MENTDSGRAERTERTVLTKIPMGKFLMHREKDRTGKLSAAARRGTTENAPVRDFREAQKEAMRLSAGPSGGKKGGKMPDIGIQNLQKAASMRILNSLFHFAFSRRGVREGKDSEKSIIRDVRARAFRNQWERER